MREQEISDRRRERLVAVLAVALVFSSMNATMFHVALPAVSAQFALTPAEVSWVVTGYMIIYAVGSVVYGKLADQYDIRRVITVALLLFGAGSLVGWLATAYWLVLAGRVLQAMGASVLPSASVFIPARYFSPETRGKALGVTLASFPFGVAVGPIIAGFLTTWFHWRLLFLISFLAVFTLPFFRKYLDHEPERRPGKTDYPGALLLGGAVAFLLLAISYSVGAFAVAGVLLGLLFYWRIHRAEEPFIQPSLLKNRAYIRAVSVYGLGAGTGFGLSYATPLALIEVNQMTAFESGLLMFPGAAGAAVLSRIGGRLADRKGNVFLAYLALGFYFLCFSVFSCAVGFSPAWIMAFLIFGYSGLTMFQLAMANTVSLTLPRDQTGVGMGMFMLVNFIACSAATALIGTALTHPAQAALNPLPIRPEGVPYSNVYAVSAMIMVVIGVLYTLMRRAQTAPLSGDGPQIAGDQPSGSVSSTTGQ